MRQTKITLAIVLLIVAATGFGFATFLSINFLTLGDIKESITVAVIITLILAGLALMAQKFKRAQRNFKTNIALEMLSILLFVIAAYFALQPYSHVFTVFQHKENIEDRVVENINQAQKMFESYESYASTRQSTYESTLTAVEANKENNREAYENIYGFDDSRSGGDQIHTKIITLRYKLFPSNYENDTLNGEGGVKGAAEKWLNDVSSKVENDFGFMFGIVNIMNEVPVKTEEWKTYLVDLSKFSAVGEDYPEFSYDLSFSTVKSQLTTNKSPTVMSIVVACFAYILMLLPYLLAKRSSKYPGLKIIFGGSGFSENEL